MGKVMVIHDLDDLGYPHDLGHLTNLHTWGKKLLEIIDLGM